MNSYFSYFDAFLRSTGHFGGFVILVFSIVTLYLIVLYLDLSGRGSLKKLEFQYSKNFPSVQTTGMPEIELGPADWETKSELDFDYSLVPSPEYLYFLKDPTGRWIHFRDPEERADYIKEYYSARKVGGFFTEETELLAGKLTHFYFKSGLSD